MGSKFTLKVWSVYFVAMLIVQIGISQNSVLVNFGSNTCTNSTLPNFSLIKNPLSGNPVLLANCDLAAQQSDYFSVFIAYNPKNNKLYVADIRSGTQTKIWVLDIGLPLNITCPLTIPVTPTYTYTYVSNNFEFDNNGDLWSFSNYNSSTGQCNMDKFDVNTGTVINTRILQFPAGNFPTTISSGDLTILPNGRMFASLGSGTCRLYEINNYSSTSGNASANYLATLPKDCYGIAYLNGILELTGSDFTNTCYYYDYNISTNVLGSEKTFQNGQSPIDNTSFTPSIGSTKRLLSATKINSNTADLTYEVYAENMGNVILNNINVTDDLAKPYGASNVSNVSVSFVPGSNAAGLTLNPSYNGTSNTSLLNNGQNLPNKILSNRDYFFKILINCRVTNLNASTYLNSAIAKADIGSGNLASLVNVSDSSNNGDSTFIDPNKNGNAGDVGENIPTPFVFATLPVKFINVTASLQNKNTATVKWQVATPLVNAAKFEIEFSLEGRTFKKLSELFINNLNEANYQFTHLNIPVGYLYYRIKQIDTDGSFTYSKIVLLNNKSGNSGFVIYPNPAGNTISISAADFVETRAVIELYDAVGRLLVSKTMSLSTEEINTSLLPDGTYLLKILSKDYSSSQKIIVHH